MKNRESGLPVKVTQINMTDHVQGFPLSSTFYDATHYHRSPFGGPAIRRFGTGSRAGTVVTSSVDSGQGLRWPHFIRGPPHGVTIPNTQSRFIKFIFPASHQLLGKPCCVLFFLEIVVMPREKRGLDTKKDPQKGHNRVLRTWSTSPTNNKKKVEWARE